MGKVVLDITMSAGSKDEIDPLRDQVFSGEAGDASHLTDSGSRLPDEAIIANRPTYNAAKSWVGGYHIPSPVFVLTHHIPQNITKDSIKFTSVAGATHLRFCI